MPEAFALDPDRIARLQREALLLASLNHPNIATIHGLEEADGIRGLVMELVEGPTLADRIAQGPIPLDEMRDLARQIADALQVAHEHGIIHRDLKPANIKVKRDGSVKLLDFGLAKLFGAQAGHTAPSNSPTLPESMPGLVLGTPAYMSPEQAMGHPANRRADVWAYGCVVFEMLTGHAPFEGRTTSEILANVLKSEPDWHLLPGDTPEAIQRLLRRCLQKDQKRRLGDVGDARLELDEVDTEARVQPGASQHGRRERLAWGCAVAILSLFVVTLVVRNRRPVSAPAEVRFDTITPAVSDPFDLSSLAVSADGRQLLFVANADGQPHVWLHALDSSTSRPLRGTGGASFPFWSPDSRSIAFYADGVLKRLDLDGGLVRTLTKATAGAGGTWNTSGVILFVANPASPISRLSADGGTAADVTRLERGQAGHSFPHFLPDGQHFVYYVTANPESRGIYLGQLDGSPSRKVLDADPAAVYASGHLLYVRSAAVFAQAFDINRLELTGSPFQVLDGVQPGTWWGGYGALSAAPGGVIAARIGGAKFGRQFVWVNRSGEQTGTIGDVRDRRPTGSSVSLDGHQLVFFERGDRSSDLWILDTRRGVSDRFTDHPAEDIFPIWSRDGHHIVFSSNRTGLFSLYRKKVTGADSEELLLPPHPDEVFATDTSPDGQWLLYQRSSKSGWDIWALPLHGGDPKPVPILQTDADERSGLLSPDGKWLAYVANGSGPSEVYVQPFPGPGPRAQVSTKGGDQIRWRADGHELFYIGTDGNLMAARFEDPKDGQPANVEAPVRLFSTHVGRVVNLPAPTAQYAPSADGQRFLMNNIIQAADQPPVRLILNWKPQP